MEDWSVAVAFLVSEERNKPSRNAPFTIISLIITNGVFIRRICEYRSAGVRLKLLLVKVIISSVLSKILSKVIVSIKIEREIR